MGLGDAVQQHLRGIRQLQGANVLPQLQQAPHPLRARGQAGRGGVSEEAWASEEPFLVRYPPTAEEHGRVRELAAHGPLRIPPGLPAGSMHVSNHTPPEGSAAARSCREAAHAHAPQEGVCAQALRMFPRMPSGEGEGRTSV